MEKTANNKETETKASKDKEHDMSVESESINNEAANTNQSTVENTNESIDSSDAENSDEYKQAQNFIRAKAIEAEKKEKAKAELLESWNKDIEEIKKFNPNFDFNEETENNSEFTKLIYSGIGVQTAYNAVHMEEIKQANAKQTSESIYNDLIAKAQRPAESALNERAQSLNGTSVKNLNKKQREDIAKRAQRGERIIL